MWRCRLRESRGWAKSGRGASPPRPDHVDTLATARIAVGARGPARRWLAVRVGDVKTADLLLGWRRLCVQARRHTAACNGKRVMCSRARARARSLSLSLYTHTHTHTLRVPPYTAERAHRTKIVGVHSWQAPGLTLLQSMFSKHVYVTVAGVPLVPTADACLRWHCFPVLSV